MGTHLDYSRKPSSMSEINITPMIDVLLVLLVIFMLAQPLLQRSIDLQLPLAERSQATAVAPPIVLEISASGEYTINHEPVPAHQLEARLREIYMHRPDKLLFVRGNGEVIYQDVIAAMDAARAAGVAVLGALLNGESSSARGVRQQVATTAGN